MALQEREVGQPRGACGDTSEPLQGDRGLLCHQPMQVFCSCLTGTGDSQVTLGKMHSIPSEGSSLPRSAATEPTGAADENERPPITCLQLLRTAGSRQECRRPSKVTEQAASTPQSTYQPGLILKTHRVLLQDDNSAMKAGKPELQVGAGKGTEQECLEEQSQMPPPNTQWESYKSSANHTGAFWNMSA